MYWGHTKAEPALRRVLHVSGYRPDKPNSVPSKEEDGHLSGTIVTDGLERRSHPKVGTALHRGKDLAVSPLDHSEDALRGEPLSFRNRAFLFAPRALRRTGVTRYPAAAEAACVRTFLSGPKTRATVWTGPHALYNKHWFQLVRKIDLCTNSPALRTCLSCSSLEHIADRFRRSKGSWIGDWGD